MQFSLKKCICLGHEISSEGIRPPPQKIEIIKNYPVPKNAKELKRTLGLFNWFKKFIPNYSVIANPLYYLLKKKVPFQWTLLCEDSFQRLKDSLVNSSALAFPRYDREFRLAVDSCSKGIGYMLYQYDENQTPRVVRFGSKGLSRWQQSYGPTKLELLGLVSAVMDCASYVRGRHFVVECDHQALAPIFQKKLKGQVYERWLAILQQFDLDIVYKPAAEMVVPDSLSRRTVYSEVLNSSPEEDDPYFPYVEEKPSQVRIISPENKIIQTYRFASHARVHKHDSSQNVYDADTEDNIIQGGVLKQRLIRKEKKPSRFHKGKSHNEQKIQFRTLQMNNPCTDISDDKSQFSVVEKQTLSTENHELQPGSQFSVDGSQLSDFKEQTLSSESQLSFVRDQTLSHENQVPQPSSQTSGEASQLSAVDNYIISGVESSQFISTDQELSTGNQETSQNETIQAIETSLKELDMTADCIHKCQYADTELKPIMIYLTKGILPKSQVKARSILLQQSDYLMVQGILFHTRTAKAKRTKLFCKYQLVLPKALIQTILRLYHDSPLAGHSGIQDTIDRVKENYFFNRLSQIVSDYVRSCDQCQSRKITKIHTKSAIVAYPTPQEPFSVWQVDLYGVLPVTAHGNTYLFTAVDMFSKLLYAKPIPNKDAVTVSEVLMDLFTQFGTCDTLICDHGSEFTAKVTAEL